VPKNLGCAGIAGVPVQNGLYAAAAGAILYAVSGTSRQISTGPSSGLAAVAASAVAVAGITGTQDVASFAAAVTAASGVLFLLLAVLKMGWIAQFLSRAVVTGFLSGAAVDVVIGELPTLTGTKAAGSNPLQELWSWLGTAGDSHLVTVLVDLGAHGVALAGEVPRGRPAFQVPRARLGGHAGTVAVAAVALVLIGFSQTAGDARTFAARHRYRIDINQESARSCTRRGVVRGIPASRAGACRRRVGGTDSRRPVSSDGRQGRARSGSGLRGRHGPWRAGRPVAGHVVADGHLADALIHACRVPGF